MMAKRLPHLKLLVSEQCLNNKKQLLAPLKLLLKQRRLILFYTYIYLPNKYRVHIKDFCQKLQTIGIDNGRIPDIYYPAHNLVIILIRYNYQDELNFIFMKSDFAPVKDFNPTEAVHVNLSYVKTKTKKLLNR